MQLALKFKRTLDICAAAILLVALAPFLAAIAAAVVLVIGRPVLFKQTRAGRHGHLFTLLKFRTMSQASDALDRLLPDQSRLSPFGQWLRASSLDELPQLWNVLKGSMSLVGPRPLLPQYVQRYDAFQRRRLEVTPGITGWAQVHGRNRLTWEARFAYDVWYVEHWSMFLDLRILFLTLQQVVRRDGISSAQHATMPEFLGSAAHRKSPESGLPPGDPHHVIEERKSAAGS